MDNVYLINSLIQFADIVYPEYDNPDEIKFSFTVAELFLSNNSELYAFFAQLDALFGATCDEYQITVRPNSILIEALVPQDEDRRAKWKEFDLESNPVLYEQLKLSLV